MFDQSLKKYHLVQIMGQAPFGEWNFLSDFPTLREKIIIGLVD